MFVDLPELLAEPIEERVATDGKCVGDGDGSVGRRSVGADVARVLEHAAHTAGAHVVGDRLELVLALVEIRLVGADDTAVHRRPRDERFERRPEVVTTLHSTIDEHRLVGIGLTGDRVDLVGEQLVELVAVDRTHPSVVEPRIAGHRDDLSVGVVLHHDRAGRRLVLDPLLRAELLRAGVHARGAVRVLRVDRVVGGDILKGEIGRQVATLLELGLQRLLRVLLVVEVDRQLDVFTGDRVDVLVEQLAHDASRGVDLEDLLAPRAVQRILHRQLDAERADQLVGVVALRLVLVDVLLGDRAEVPDDVAGQRRVRIHTLPLLDDLNAREVLAALLQVRDRVFVDVFLQRQRQQRAEALTLGALGDGRRAEARVVALLQIDDRHLQRTGEPFEQPLAVLRLLDHAPVDGDGEDPLVVGHDPALGIEDAAAFGRDQDLAQLGGRHLRLEAGGLDTLQEPQARAEKADQQHRYQRQHSEPGGAPIDCHRTIVVHARP